MLSRLAAPVLLVFLAGCGVTREAVIHRTSVGLTAARAAFTAEDERLQMAIVDSAESKLEAERKIQEHRKKRDAATKVFQAAWAALAVASIEPSDANMSKLMELAGRAVGAMQGAQR